MRIEIESTIAAQGHTPWQNERDHSSGNQCQSRIKHNATREYGVHLIADGPDYQGKIKPYWAGARP